MNSIVKHDELRFIKELGNGLTKMIKKSSVDNHDAQHPSTLCPLQEEKLGSALMRCFHVALLNTHRGENLTPLPYL
ncbi:unnamed protein product [Cochlearia groenlandica]